MAKPGGIFKAAPDDGEQPVVIGAGKTARRWHVLWAAIVALALAFPMLLEPVDWTAWTIQSKFDHRAASDDIVYVGIDGVTDADEPATRLRIAKALDALRSQGSRAVFLDVAFDEPSQPAADRELARASAAWGPNLAYVDRIETLPTGEVREIRNLERFASANRRVVQPVSSQWPSFSYAIPFAYRTSTGERPSFPAALAGAEGGGERQFRIDYGIQRFDIPTLPLDALIAGRAPGAVSLGGRMIVIGFDRGAVSTDLHVPGQMAAPTSFVAIQAAETLKRGGLIYVPGMVVALFLAISLALAAGAEGRLARRSAYALVATLPLVLVLLASPLGLQVELSYALPLFGVFVALRSRSNWKQRIAQIDPDTGLPTFRAFAFKLSQRDEEGGHVVVAKIHGYETILKSLDRGQRVAYLRKLVERLRVADQKLAVYIENHYLGWRVEHEDEGKLRGHLEGLRAIFAAPVTVGQHSIDVGITFGAAPVETARPDRSLAAALAAAEETSEALEPVKLAEQVQQSDTLWDLSLRSRIDAAMEAGEVFCVYQPKIDIAEDKIVGVEALVRWEDPERGFIPPMHFVMQCEKAGRMEYLTRYVLQSACSAAKLLHFRGSKITMSVNISATLLTDTRIVGIVRNVIQATGFDPNYLVLEITETARIRDLTTARSVLKALKALGTHLSMDDFGVGAANFEALQALPFDEIKIDRQFVSRAASSTKARAITASIVGLGASARIAVVAEGAETESDLALLREIGCWQVQGFALARPMPLTNLLSFVDDNAARERSAAV